MRRRYPSFLAATLLLLGCEPPPRASQERSQEQGPNASAAVPSLAPTTELLLPARHAAFVELEENSYTLGLPDARQEVRSGAARLAYRFAPADAQDAPLCIVLSGGPAVTSTMMQRAFGVTKDSSGLLAGLCHALFIDARNTGFSYNLAAAAAAPGEARFTLGDNNPYADAADFIRVFLDLGLRYPDLGRRPLLVLGESYGGVRATLLVDLMLHPESYRAGERRARDEALLDSLASAEAALGVRWAEQLRHQVLLQPTLTGSAQDDASGRLFEQPGSPVFLLAEELGQTFEPCSSASCDPYFNAINAVESWGRSIYASVEPSGWLERKMQNARELMQTTEGVALLLGAEPSSVSGLAAFERGDAWRLATTGAEAADAAWPASTWGSLGALDRYFIPFNNAVFMAFSSAEAQNLGVDWLDPLVGEYFLANSRSVRTFLTRARYDLVNYSPGLIAALGEYPSTASVALDESGTEQRTGHVLIRYSDGVAVELRSPEYEAGHGIIAARGAELVADISEWLLQAP